MYIKATSRVGGQWLKRFLAVETRLVDAPSRPLLITGPASCSAIRPASSEDDLLAHALAGVALLCHIVSIDNTHSRYNFLECHPALRSRVEECEAFIWCCSCPPSAFCRRPAGARRRKAPAFAKTTRFELKVTNLNEIAQTLAALEASQFLIVISSPNAAQSKYVSEEARRFNRLRSAWGQKLLLPQCKSNGRFTSVSGHKGRRSWMMRALRILDSPYAPTLGILRDFQDNLLPVSRVRRRGQAGCC